MLCQICKKNNATVHYKVNINGKASEANICSECAKLNNIGTVNIYNSFGNDVYKEINDDIFGGLFAAMSGNGRSARVGADAKACPACGMRMQDFIRDGKIGCAECYRNFETSLAPTIKKIHSNATHCGKVPENIGKKDSTEKKIDSLKKKLAEAVENQEYELAAKYRDEIKALETDKGADE